MGIKHFFIWFKNQFSKDIISMKEGQTFGDVNTPIDNLMLDLNGILHNSAQKVYEYGNFKPQRSFLGFKKKKFVSPKVQQENFFKEVCSTIENLLKISQPRKRLIMCIDGPAPFAKCVQQRARRFRSASEKTEEEMKNSFDQNQLSPGTKLMDHLSKYIDWYIRKRISEDPVWQNIEVVFSNEKVCGEGEHRLMAYVRKYGTDEESYCLHALDADIIMLALASHKPNFYVLREDLYDPGNAFFNINIGEVRKHLVEMLKFEHKNFRPDYAVNDFVFLAFTVGNDFLPHIPSLEILEGGIDVIIDVYKNVGKGYGHITQKSGDKILFVRHALEVFMGTISQYEKGMLEEKMNRKHSFFPDVLLEKHCKFVEMQNVLNIDEYRSEYLYNYFPEDAHEEKICHEYLEGMQWVLSYYTSGLTNWDWSYPYHYAPFAFHLSRHTRTFKFLKYPNTSPVAPYIQLLSILPPKSAKLLPEPLDKILTSSESPLKLYCPDDIVIDFSGKRKEWEGIVILPMIDREIVKKEYFKYVDKVDRRELNRNKLGKSFIYKYNDGFSTVFSSYYGDIKDCKVYTTIIEL